MCARKSETRAAPEGDHEAKCRRCGLCCYEKYIIDGWVFTTNIPCVHLDLRTKLCTIYHERRRINPECLDVPGGIRLGVFPADCPYVADLPDYRPPFGTPLSEDVIAKIESGELRDPAEVIRLLKAKQQNAHDTKQ